MTLRIRQDIRDQYASLFGSHTANGRTLVVEDLIADMTAAISAELPQLLAARHRFQEKVASGDARYDFLPGTDEIADADGNTTTAAAIRRGLLDGFFGRDTADAWRLNATVPIPADTMRPGLEGTGPAIDLGMAMGALNSGASQWMWDWEDAGRRLQGSALSRVAESGGHSRPQMGREAVRAPDEGPDIHHRRST